MLVFLSYIYLGGTWESFCSKQKPDSLFNILGFFSHKFSQYGTPTTSAKITDETLHPKVRDCHQKFIFSICHNFLHQQQWHSPTWSQRNFTIRTSLEAMFWTYYQRLTITKLWGTLLFLPVAEWGRSRSRDLGKMNKAYSVLGAIRSVTLFMVAVLFVNFNSSLE